MPVRRRDLLTAALCTAALSGCSAVDRLRGAPAAAAGRPERPACRPADAGHARADRGAQHRARAVLPPGPRVHRGRRRRRAPVDLPARRAAAPARGRAGRGHAAGHRRGARRPPCSSGTPLADNAVLVSFDDASGGQYTNALPILQRLGIPATFFVMTVVLDRPNWLSRDDVRALDAAGMTIASHTWDHHPVTRYGDQDWATQLEKPREQLEQIVRPRRRPVRLPVRPVEPGRAPARRRRRATGRPSSSPSSRRTPQLPLLTVRRVLTLPSWDVPTLLTRISPDHPAE